MTGSQQPDHLAGAAGARWRRWRARHGATGAFGLLAWGVLLVAGALQGDFPVKDREKPRHGWVRFVAPLSSDPGARNARRQPWLRLCSLACAGAWAGHLTYDPAAATLFWRPSGEWRDRRAPELLASTADIAAVEHRTYGLGRRRVVRVTLTGGGELWFTSSVRDPATASLLRPGHSVPYRVDDVDPGIDH